MILKELFYFDDKTLEPTEDNHYDPNNDDSIHKPSDSRKSKLTLKDINKVRKASDQHKIEQEKDLEFIKQMYGIAANTEAAGI